MTAAVTLGSAAQTLGAGAVGAVQALPTVAGAGAHAIASGASAAAQALPTLPAALPAVVDTGVAGSTALVNDLGIVDKSVQAAAKGVPRSSAVLRAAGFLRVALPAVTMGASALAGAQVVKEAGVDGLLYSKRGRGAVLGAVGGAFLLIPHPVSQFAAAGVLGTVAVNEFGGLERFDRALPASPK